MITKEEQQVLEELGIDTNLHSSETPTMTPTSEPSIEVKEDSEDSNQSDSITNVVDLETENEPKAFNFPAFLFQGAYLVANENYLTGIIFLIFGILSPLKLYAFYGLLCGFFYSDTKLKTHKVFSTATIIFLSIVFIIGKLVRLYRIGEM